MTGEISPRKNPPRRLLAEMRPYWASVVLVLVVSVSAAPLALITPLPIKIIVDNVIGSQSLPGYLGILAPNPSQLSKEYVIVLAIAILLGAALLTSLQNLANVWLSNKVGNRMTLEMRARLFRQLQRLSLLYHDTKGTVDSVYRVQYDAASLRALSIDGLIPIITDLFTLVGMIVVTLILDLQLAFIALLVTPIMFSITLVYRRRLRQGWRKIKTSESAAMSAAQESLSAARVVKAFGQEERKNEQFVSRYSETLAATLRVNVEGGVYNLLIGVTTAAGLAAVLFVGVAHVQAGTLTLGALLIVNIYLTQFYNPLKDLGKKILDIQMSLAGMERFLEVLDEEPDVIERPNARPLARARGRIAFENVSFEYVKSHAVLRGASFVLPPGRCLGVVGPTGSGKTTLSSLILRFFDPTEGAITLDDLDLRDYKVLDLRNQFAVVLQDTLLFSTTIAENIRFARPHASFDEVVAAAKAAEAHDFISRLPEGYDTLVGERGMRLSAGERQRVSLARAFLKDAPILILDEPTSSLDTKTEAAIMKTMDGLIEGRTTLLIAHRPTTVSYCDLVLVLEEGRIVEVTTEVPTLVRRMLEPDSQTQEGP